MIALPDCCLWFPLLEMVLRMQLRIVPAHLDLSTTCAIITFCLYCINSTEEEATVQLLHRFILILPGLAVDESRSTSREDAPNRQIAIQGAERNTQILLSYHAFQATILHLPPLKRGSSCVASQSFETTCMTAR